MPSRHKNRFFAETFAAAIILIAAVPSKAGEFPSSETNLLLVTIDTLRPDRLSCYGSKYLQTLNIDAVANRGVVFEKAYAHNPETLPSHANILLGLLPVAHGVSINGKAVVKEEFITMAEHLKSRGYATGAFIGAFPLDSRFGLAQGFDIYDDHLPSKTSLDFNFSERKAETVVRSARTWLDGRKDKWFCWIHLWDPHVPYTPPEPYATRFKTDPYSGEVAYMDAELGKLFADLENRGWSSRTLIIITADHAESLGEHGELTHGYFAYNSTLGVPLIIAEPGRKSGRVKDDVCHVDIFPTVCKILNIPAPQGLQGRSLLPLMEGRMEPARGIYFETMDPHLNRGWAPLRGIIRNGMKYMDTPLPEIYDLRQDFGERRNLAEETDLGPYRRDLQKLVQAPSSKSAPLGQTVNRETIERLKSLGYTVSPVTRIKKSYGPEDDIKTLFPFQHKIDQAIIAVDKGKSDEGVRLLKEIIRDRKDFVTAYSFLSILYANQGLREESLQVLQEGYKNNPGDYSIVSAFGFSLYNNELIDPSIGVLEKALSLYDRDPEVWNYLGLAYWRRNEPAKAMDIFQKTLSLDASFALTYCNIGVLHLSSFNKTHKAEELSQAIEYFQKAVSFNSEFELAHKSLGTAFWESHRIDSAIESWEKALALKSSDDYVAKSLGIAYLEKGNKAKALECFNRILAVRKTALSPDERRQIDELIKKCKDDRPA